MLHKLNNLKDINAATHMALYLDKALRLWWQGASGGESGLLKRDGELYQIQVGGSLGAGSMTTWYVLGTKITHKQMLKPHYAHTVPSNIINSGTNLHLRNKCQSTTDCFTEEEITQPPNTTSPSAHRP